MLQGKTAAVTGPTSGIGLGIAEVEQRAALAVFLCCDAAAQMTGQPVLTDGGRIAL